MKTTSETVKMTQVLVNIDGQPLQEDGKDATVGKILAKMLVTHKPDPLRSFLLSQELYKADKNYELKASDIPFLKEVVNDNQNYFSIVRGQLLNLLK